jgi:hypothetical protein
MEAKVLLETKDGFTQVVALPEDIRVKEIDRDAEGVENHYTFEDGEIQHKTYETDEFEFSHEDRQEAEEQYIVVWTPADVLAYDYTNQLTTDDAKYILDTLHPNNLSTFSVKAMVHDLKVKQ